MNEVFVGLITISIAGSFLFVVFMLFDHLGCIKSFVWQYVVMKGLLLFFLVPAVLFPFLYFWERQPQEVIMEGDDLTHWTLYEANISNILEKDWSHFTILFFIIWLIGFCFVFVRGVIKDKRAIEEMSILAKKEESKEILEIQDRIQKELKIKKEIPIYRSTLVSSPCITGWKETKIFLPKVSFSNKEIELLLKHELYHYKKRDIIYNFLIAIFWGIHWFNPIIWIFTAQIYNFCEVACDQFVLNGTSKGVRELYANLLIKIAEVPNKRKYGLTSFTNEDTKFMKRRVYFIMKSTKRKKGLSLIAVALGVVLAPTATYASAVGVTNVYDKVLENTGVFYEQPKEVQEIKEFVEPEFIPDIVTFSIEERGTTTISFDMAGNGSAESKYFSVKKGEQLQITLMGEKVSDKFKVEVIFNNKVQASKTSVEGDVRFSYIAKSAGDYKLKIKNLESEKISVVGRINIG